jgi:hypothetical protein
MATIVLSGYLVAPSALSALHAADSIDVTQLLNEAKAEAVELRDDSADLESFARSNLSWDSHARKTEMVKDHINNTGKLLAKLKGAEVAGSPWQRTAISRIGPLLKELAANTGATINHLNENRARIHFAEFQDYVRANYEIAVDLEALIRDFVSYGEAKQEFERLGKKIGISD